MRRTKAKLRIGLGLLLAAAIPALTQAPRRIEISRSHVLIRVYKAGLFSAFAHNHEIAAPLAAGQVVLTGDPAVDLRFETGSLHVLDPGSSSEDRAKIQQTMLGPEVLDAARFPEIDFRSRRVETTSPGHWRIEGDLTLHGVTHPVALAVAEDGGVYQGSVSLRQSQFGIRPIRLAGGTVKVKDQVRIEFAIRLVPASARQDVIRPSGMGEAARHSRDPNFLRK